jgi:hypothetical protein
MPEDLRRLVVAPPGLRQWDVLAAVFIGLVCLWARLLIQKSCDLWLLWLVLSLIASAMVLLMWKWERWPARPDA